MSIKNITVLELDQIRRHKKAIMLIDVLSPERFAKSHISNSLNTPLLSLNPKALMTIRGECADEPLYIICQAGITSLKACEKFIAAGFENVINIEGGKKAWSAAGLPLEKGTIESPFHKHKTSLTILLGSMLSLLIHPTFAVLPLFAGLWLLFSARSAY